MAVVVLEKLISLTILIALVLILVFKTFWIKLNYRTKQIHKIEITQTRGHYN